RFAAYSAGAVDLAVGVALVVMGTQNPHGSGLRFGGWVLIASCWLPPWVLLAVRYEIGPDALIVRRGPIAKRIPLDSVDEVRSSAPLPGLEGVIVSYRKGTRRVREPLFPDDPTEFLRQLGQLASFLEPAADGTLRRAR